jgi:hypothetical protein
LQIRRRKPENLQGVKVNFDPNGAPCRALGIIEFDGEHLRLCSGECAGKGNVLDEDSRPAVFAAGSNVLFLECRKK